MLVRSLDHALSLVRLHDLDHHHPRGSRKRIKLEYPCPVQSVIGCILEIDLISVRSWEERIWSRRMNDRIESSQFCLLEGNKTPQRAISGLSIVIFEQECVQFQHIFGTTTVNERV